MQMQQELQSAIDETLQALKDLQPSHAPAHHHRELDFRQGAHWLHWPAQHAWDPALVQPALTAPGKALLVPAALNPEQSLASMQIHWTLLKLRKQLLVAWAAAHSSACSLPWMRTGLPCNR